MTTALHREIIEKAIELDSIRSVYGDGCWDFVVKALQRSDSPWDEVVESAVDEWSNLHPRLID